MIPPLNPVNETCRLAVLRSLNILDTLPEERFDRYTRLSQRLFGVPIALVTLVDDDRQWFKSRQGLPACKTTRAVSFCGHAILQTKTMVVCDAHEDPRFADNPLVQGDPNIRFYAGRPLRGSGGHALGTLCIIDNQPRVFSTEDAEALDDLAAMVEQELMAVQHATTDVLTGLSNRRGFTTVAEHLLSICRREEKDAVMVFIDLDRFKQTNDTFGHAAGDQALQATAALLSQVFRGSDIVGRLGGDEFCVLCTSTADEASLVQRITAAFASHNATSSTPWSIEVSVGAVRFDPEAHQSVEDILGAADVMMYAAKFRRAAG